MESFCIKTNNKNIQTYLLNRLESIDLDTLYLSQRNFKLYTNLIIHYKGKNTSEFYNKLSDILLDCILSFYEPIKLREIIHMNYFYFSDSEKRIIEENCMEFLNDDDNIEKEIRIQHIYISILKYLTENKSMILDGFVNFRMQEYMKILDYIVDTSVNRFLIEKEYTEFIHLLKLYINSKEPEIDTVHLIYSNGESILIDEEKNIISVTDNIFNAKYLSDISFSSNDYSLNTLLSILPNRIIIHLIDGEDEFINTIKLIFDNKVQLCEHCSLCKTYRLIHSSNIQRQ